MTTPAGHPGQPGRFVVGPPARSPEGLGGRLPLLAPGALDADQRALYDYLQQTKLTWAASSGFQAQLPDGRLIGPFNAFLYSPRLGRGFNDWVDAETAHTTLTPTVRQIVVLTVGAAWDSAYELYAHTAVARTTSLTDPQTTALAGGQEPAGLTDTETAAHHFTRALVTDRHVDDKLYQHTVGLLGTTPTVQMTHLIGQYLATCALLNAFAVPAPSPDAR